jgi:dTDP-4-dehydrorhamnose reductase
MPVVGEAARPVLIAGARGTLGAAFVRLCEARGIVVNAVTRADLDITSALAVRRTIEMRRPWAVINAAGFVRVDDAERERSDCYRINTLGVGILAAECARAGIPLLTFSSDLVFDGQKGAPYVESDRVNPVNTYGASKAAAELRAFELHASTLVVRTSAFFGPWDGSNFVTTALRTLADGLPFVAASDVIVSPTYVPDLVHASLDLLLDGESGVWHLANQGAVSWSELARDAACRAGLAREMVKEARADELGRAARQPSYTVLCSERCALLPTLEDAMDRYFSQAALPTLTAVTA